MEFCSSFLKEKDAVGGSLSIFGDSIYLNNKLQVGNPARRGPLFLQAVALCLAGRVPVSSRRGFCDQLEGVLCLLPIKVNTAPEAVTDSANLQSLGPAAMPSSATWRKVCLGSAPTGETRAGESGQGVMEWGQHRTVELPTLPCPQQLES